MIVKDLDNVAVRDKRSLAGYEAEKQMAFYLQRAFGDDPNVLVINGLRLRRQGDVAQVDHLVLHPRGIIIVESKSVTTRVQVNAQGEWSRWTGKQWQGMPSPMLQAQRQAEFLRKFLRGLRDLGQSVDWQALPIDLMIAISDNGMINRPGNQPLAGVYKAEQVTEQIRTIVQRQGKGETLLNWLKVVFDESNRILKESTLKQLAQGLIKHHWPRGPLQKADWQQPDDRGMAGTTEQCEESARAVEAAQGAEPVSIPQSPNNQREAKTSPVCQHCQGDSLQIVYGKYGYYFKCKRCDRNTSIQVSCTSCGQRAKVRKQKQTFFADCKTCGTSRMFFRNPLPEQS
jgi:transcription elongation factor Elf1